MYAECWAYGNRGDYVNQAIDNYKQAIKADPSTPMLSEELSDLYVQSGGCAKRKAMPRVLKQNPNDLNAHRLLALFLRAGGDGQQNKIDEQCCAAHRSIPEDHAIDAKDVEAG